MPSYDQITDEEELHKMMNNTEDFDERKKIRARLRDIRDKAREDMEAKRKERAAAAEDEVKKRFERAEEEKKRKMEAFKVQATKTEEEKAKKMAAYSQVSQSKTGPGGQKVTTTTTKTATSQSLTAKPQGAQGAMAAFKQMDNAANPAPARSKVARSPSAIKQVLLDWSKGMTRGYPNVEVTNFSSSWNNGMAFCALIHHFFPDAFDFSQLDPKKRRYNFTLAFDTGEQKADIMPLLDVDDMVKMKNPDWKCVFTYVQSIYRHLRDHENNKVMPCPVAASPEQ